MIPAADIVDLFSSEKRSCLIEKWSLATASFDFVVEKLDFWENLIDDDVLVCSVNELCFIYYKLNCYCLVYRL